MHLFIKNLFIYIIITSLLSPFALLPLLSTHAKFIILLPPLPIPFSLHPNPHSLTILHPHSPQNPLNPNHSPPFQNITNKHHNHSYSYTNFTSSHLISLHLTSSHLISPHLIYSRFFHIFLLKQDRYQSFTPEKISLPTIRYDTMRDYVYKTQIQKHLCVFLFKVI